MHFAPEGAIHLFSQPPTARIPKCYFCLLYEEGLKSHNMHFALPSQIVPYFGLLFTCFEMCKQVCLYRNGYIVSPLSYKLKPGVDQSLGPYELQEVKRYLKNRRFQNSSMGNRWWDDPGLKLEGQVCCSVIIHWLNVLNFKMQKFSGIRF